MVYISEIGDERLSAFWPGLQATSQRKQWVLIQESSAIT